MNLAHDQHQPSRFRKVSVGSLKAILGTYLLVDDFVWKRTGEVAKGVEIISGKLTRGRFPINQTKLAYATLFGVSTVAPVIIYPNPFSFIFAVENSIINLLLWARGIRHASYCGGGADNTETLCIVRTIYGTIRFPILTYAGYKLAGSLRTTDEVRSSMNLEDFFYYASLSVSLYLSSGSSGIIDRIKKWTKQKIEEIKAVVAKPATNFQVTEPTNNSSI